ncbi:MAG: response regulator [Planctomycetales bacterium]|nr:response regulator [Planctomycetales bacterium]
MTTTQVSEIRVLVVDDEPSLLDILGRYLNGDGFRVRSAGSAIEALRSLEREAADVVVTDLAMPGLGGELLAERIRAIAPRAAVIVVSGWITPAVRRRLEAAGIRAFVTKPIASLEGFSHLIRAAAPAGAL